MLIGIALAISFAALLLSMAVCHLLRALIGKSSRFIVGA
jgi:hypothetical protein